MLSDEEFIDCVWNKYNNLCNLNKTDNFYKKDFYKRYDAFRILSQVASFIIVAIATVSVVYAGSIVYEYLQKRSKPNYESNMNSYFEISDNEIYYKTIDNYEDYVTYKNKWNNIIEVTEEDFEKNFVIVIVATWRMPDIAIKDIYNDDETLYIIVDNDLTTEAKEREEYMVSSILPKKLKRDKIKVMINKKTIITNKYKRLEELPNEYTSAEAEKDGCIVVKDNVINIAGSTLINNFMENPKNEKYIRIATYEDNEEFLTIYDVQYIDNEYILYIDYTRSKSSVSKGITYIGKFHNIDKKEITNGLNMIYLEDIFNKTIPIIIYK